MDQIDIARAGANDLHTLRELGMQTFIEAFAADNTEDDMLKYLSEKFSQEKISEELNNPDSIFFIARYQGEAVGYLKLNKGGAQTEYRDRNCMEIERIYVLQSMHGKRVGHLLLQTAITEAFAADVEFLWLGVWEHNDKAIRFYQKHGFESFGSHIFMLGNDAQTDILMKLPMNNGLANNL